MGRCLNELALFAGAGGGILGSLLLGHRPVCAVESDGFARSILLARQDDGILPPFPVWDKIETFVGEDWRGIVDIVSGGFPCQDISACNMQGKGIDGERSGLWSEMARVIGEVRPRFVFVENSSMLVVRGLDRVLADLAEMGFDAEWGIVGADDVGAPHIRKRIWILAEHPDPDRGRCEVERIETSGREIEVRSFSHGLCPGGYGNGSSGNVFDPMFDGSSTRISETEARGQREAKKSDDDRRGASGIEWWKTEPGICKLVDGMDLRVDKLRAIGNGQVPRVVEVAWKILRERLRDRPDK